MGEGGEIGGDQKFGVWGFKKFRVTKIIWGTHNHISLISIHVIRMAN